MGIFLRDKKVTGGAWLSSARVVRCWVRIATGAAPIGAIIQLNSSGFAGNKPEEGGDDVKSSCPL